MTFEVPFRTLGAIRNVWLILVSWMRDIQPKSKFILKEATNEFRQCQCKSQLCKIIVFI